MKTYLVTYYFEDGTVHAVRYETEIYVTSKQFVCTLIDKKFITDNKYYEVINIDKVLRFTIDELEGDEEQCTQIVKE